MTDANTNKTENLIDLEDARKLNKGIRNFTRVLERGNIFTDAEDLDPVVETTRLLNFFKRESAAVSANYRIERKLPNGLYIHNMLEVDRDMAFNILPDYDYTR